ncbi:MAG TPA: metal-dependent transcriptional regulator [Gemmatimonadales bacterium]|nr:metal-dependent transcriptional regulator [Gemmatimonadales bacterium]
MTAALRTGTLTRSVEDYLKAIYHLSGAGQPATTSDIAQHLDVSAPSVSGMVKRLADQGLLEHAPYKGVELTAEGRRAALRMLRRHRIIETYLVERLGYTWDTVHVEAERLEHAVSEALIDRMATALGNPGFDPHGDPIPGPDGSMAELIYTPLSDLPEGERAVMRRAGTSDADRLRYLAEVGLVPGAALLVVARHPFNGPVTIRLGGEERVIGHGLAGQVLCQRQRGPESRA